MSTPNYFCYPAYNPDSLPYKLEVDKVDEMADDSQYVVSHQKVDQHIQYDNKKPNMEKIIQDCKAALDNYPFSVNAVSEIKQIKFRVNDATIRITENQFISDKPIQVEINDNCLNLWTADIAEHRVLTTKGQSVVDGYSMDTFSGGKVKVSRKFEHCIWNHGPLKLDNFALSGANCVVNIGVNIFSDNTDIDVVGNCKFNLATETIFEKITVFATYGDLNFGKCKTSHVDMELEGTGTISGIEVDKFAKIKIVGDGRVTIKKNDGCGYSEEIYGGGHATFV